jgi:hypothetical protein
MADLFRSSVNSFLGLGELHGELAHHLEELPALAPQPCELSPRGSAARSFAKPIVDGGFRNASVFCRLRDGDPFFLHAAEDIRFHVLGHAMIFFVAHDTKHISDRPLGLKYRVRVK